MKSILIAGSLLLVLAQHANADSLQYVYDFDAGTIDSIGNNTGGISREECEYVNVTACTWLDLEVVQNGRVLLQLVLDNPLAANLSNEALTNYSIAARGAAFYSISYGAEFGCTSGSYFGGTSDCYVETISISTDAYGAISDWAIGITSEPLSQDEYHPCCESTIPPYNYSIQSDTARSSTRWESSYPPLGGGIGNEVGFSGSEGLGTWSMAVVPVPAAVWLFGSALGLLGWMRRAKNA